MLVHPSNAFDPNPVHVSAKATSCKLLQPKKVNSGIESIVSGKATLRKLLQPVNAPFPSVVCGVIHAVAEFMVRCCSR
jgi:hypothetical protein